MSLRQFLGFIQEIGSIMYVGGILSHIVIGVVLGHSDASTAFHVYIYKNQSTDLLIIPGLALKIISDLILYFQFKFKPNWLKAKLLMTAFLATNAFVFLVPMMPDLQLLAEQSLPTGQVSQAFIDKIEIEKTIGMSNVIPLFFEMILGSFKSKLGKEKLQNK
ncbi:enoyl-CoA hydratase [Vibrio sp. DW001]|uniref:enoyl-CoA hydratase n=1 Tax=Vibrio sp. DW001 TaxID=2912315 RepID=UPI0023AF088E|nr:enoyl-CoA hydratase [Vibrio sp. DW001]WED29618.1 enoyl-CoA hydratase [Vibrio sp. DW001]